MQWAQIEKRWDTSRAQILSQWGKLTAGDLERVGGARDALIGCIAERYGVDRSDAERQVDEWLSA